jgi:NTP pyrophosphatase (non-canonical NTP hydrolase)
LNIEDVIKIRQILDAAPVPTEDRYIMNEVEWQYPFSDYQIEAVSTLGPDRNPLMIALGVGGEAGEVMEIIKKGNRPGNTVDVVHLKEEIGDVLWYLAVLADYYDLDLDEIAMENIDKLRERYGR